jgi:hypothetical protein
MSQTLAGAPLQSAGVVADRPADAKEGVTVKTGCRAFKSATTIPYRAMPTPGSSPVQRAPRGGSPAVDSVDSMLTR